LGWEWSESKGKVWGLEVRRMGKGEGERDGIQKKLEIEGGGRFRRAELK
jgi:hypothetical protein